MCDRLSDIKLGEKAKVERIDVEGSIRRRLLDMGMIPGTEVECVLCSPFGEPYAYNIRGSLIAIRNEDTRNIIVKSDSK